MAVSHAYDYVYTQCLDTGCAPPRGVGRGNRQHTRLWTSRACDRATWAHPGAAMSAKRSLDFWQPSSNECSLNPGALMPALANERAGRGAEKR